MSAPKAPTKAERYRNKWVVAQICIGSLNFASSGSCEGTRTTICSPMLYLRDDDFTQGEIVCVRPMESRKTTSALSPLDVMDVTRPWAIEAALRNWDSTCQRQAAANAKNAAITSIAFPIRRLVVGENSRVIMLQTLGA